ncbi:unnamed protein product [Spirodela intermedia]|uniref:Uncharacterized protein n=1 Tax=Spirodela intermedia TaxID=51605 RepID=A0A7I8LBH1_SPIIN|nr:unnamed protein product [Spirodela intermedia]
MTTAGLMRTTSAPLQSYGGHGGGISLFGRSWSSSSLTSARTLHLAVAGEKKHLIHHLNRVQSEADLAGGDGRITCQARRVDVEAPPESRLQLEKLMELSGGITTGSGGAGGAGGGSGGGKPGRGGSDGGKSEMGAYYLEMLEADPGNPLLLVNYGRYLHEVEGDVEGAEECYGRAILASPGDGEVLSLYGKLIWETQGDETRAESYFERAVEASPDDCYVMGSYAHFLWDADEAGEEDEDVRAAPAAAAPSQQPQLTVRAY